MTSVAEARRYIREVDEVADRDEYHGIPIELSDGTILNGKIYASKYEDTKYRLKLYRW